MMVWLVVGKIIIDRTYGPELVGGRRLVASASRAIGLCVSFSRNRSEIEMHNASFAKHRQATLVHCWSEDKIETFLINFS